MRDRMERFMEGRYGRDQLSQFLSVAALILLLIGIFARGPRISYIGEVAGIALLFWCYFRMLSRNIYRRSRENDRFVGFVGKITSGFRSGRGGYYRQSRQNRRYQQQNRSYQNHQSYQGGAQSDMYSYFICPGCQQKVRVPKGKGKISITCPRCRMEFVRRS